MVIITSTKMGKSVNWRTSRGRNVPFQFRIGDYAWPIGPASLNLLTSVGVMS